MLQTQSSINHFQQKNVNYKDGLQICVDQYLGRILIATKNFSKYEVVLKESPIVVWNNDENSLQNFLYQYVQLDQKYQDQIWDMYCPQLDNLNSLNKLKFYEKNLNKLSQIFNDLTQDQLHKLLMILESNSHEIIENDNQFQKAGLYYYGSKVAHSCSPNLFYSCKNGDGCLRYFATKEIKEGDMITIDYVSSIELSREERQIKLWNEKCFQCKCIRCSGTDDLRGFLCQCSGVLRQVKSIWQCELCLIELKQNDQLIIKAIYQEEFIKKWMLQEKYANNSHKYKETNFFDFYAVFYSQCSRYLCQTHILMINLMAFQNKIFSNICKQFEKEGILDENYKTFKQKTVDAGKKVLQSVECLHNKCAGISKGKYCMQEHEPVAITAAIVLYIYKQLLQTFEFNAYQFGVRYLKILLMAYPNFKEVLALQQQYAFQTQFHQTLCQQLNFN